MWPIVPIACAVCGGGTTEASQAAFINMTALLTFMPLIMIGAGVFYIWRRSKAIDTAIALQRLH
jgi:hypothetical protein